MIEITFGTRPGAAYWSFTHPHVPAGADTRFFMASPRARYNHCGRDGSTIMVRLTLTAASLTCPAWQFNLLRAGDGVRLRLSARGVPSLEVEALRVGHGPHWAHGSVVSVATPRWQSLPVPYHDFLRCVALVDRLPEHREAVGPGAV